MVAPGPIKRLERAIRYSAIDPFNRFRRDAYSLEGEDLILRRAFGKHLRNGFYVDVGAYHPKAASNTYLFYRRGWRGINIDARPDSMRLFRRVRPRDINIEIGIARTRGQLVYHDYDSPAFNTFSAERAAELAAGGRRPGRSIVVATCPLAEVLDSHRHDFSTLHFLNVDVEGFDVEVLASNDWTRFRPRYVLVETLGWRLCEAAVPEAVRLLRDEEYRLFARTVNTSIFVDAAFANG